MLGIAVMLLATGGRSSLTAPQDGSSLFIPGAAHVTGTAGTNWRTDVEIFNIGSEQANYEIALLEKNQDNSEPTTVSFSLNPSMSVRYDDILSGVFGFTGTAALRITTIQGELVATSRTYNQVVDGTYGQFIAAVSESQAIEFGQEARIIQLTQSQASDTGYRTNIGFLNATSAAITVQADLYRADGVFLGSPKVVSRSRCSRPIRAIPRRRPLPSAWCRERRCDSRTSFWRSLVLAAPRRCE